MIKKIIISLIALFLLSAGGVALYGYLDGIPIGFQNGRLVITQYFCSDVCPQYGGWHTQYFGVETEKDCKQLGGKSIIDPAWGSFIGCAPE